MIDFDALDSTSGQTIPLTSFSEDGYTFGLSNAPPANSDGPVIFDTLCTGYGGGDSCNNDIDRVPDVANLTGGNQGENGIADNILALQKDNTTLEPNDDASSGNSITFTLLSGTPFRLLGFLAVDDASFSMSTAADGTLGTISLTADNETGSLTFAMPSTLIGIGDSFTISYSGSGGVDSLVLAPIPVPAALPLMFGGLGLLAWGGRRRA